MLRLLLTWPFIGQNKRYFSLFFCFARGRARRGRVWCVCASCGDKFKVHPTTDHFEGGVPVCKKNDSNPAWWRRHDDVMLLNKLVKNRLPRIQTPLPKQRNHQRSKISSCQYYTMLFLIKAHKENHPESMSTEPIKTLSNGTNEAVKGKLTASILSAYDLPDSCYIGGAGQPIHVSMTLLKKEVRTGPPSARHRDRNSFKFVSENSQNGSPRKFWYMFTVKAQFIFCFKWPVETIVTALSDGNQCHALWWQHVLSSLAFIFSHLSGISQTLWKRQQQQTTKLVSLHHWKSSTLNQLCSKL